MSFTPATQSARADGEWRLGHPVFANEPFVSTPIAVPTQTKQAAFVPAGSEPQRPMNETSELSAGGMSTYPMPCRHATTSPAGNPRQTANWTPGSGLEMTDAEAMHPKRCSPRNPVQRASIRLAEVGVRFGGIVT